MADTVAAIFLIQVNDGFGIALRAVLVTTRSHLLPELGVVVDFAVEDDPDGFVLIADWLVTGRKIDDAQPAHAKPNRPVDIEPIVIGPAVGHGGAHFSHSLSTDCGVLIELDYSGYATHGDQYLRLRLQHGHSSFQSAMLLPHSSAAQTAFQRW
jgi:hypothetical protein